MLAFAVLIDAIKIRRMSLWYPYLKFRALRTMHARSAFHKSCKEFVLVKKYAEACFFCTKALKILLHSLVSPTANPAKRIAVGIKGTSGSTEKPHRKAGARSIGYPAYFLNGILQETRHTSP